jgi:aspartate/methionine/tyrosine aminotransferase
MSKDTVEEVIRFAQEKNIAILADEVYQENTYGEEFISFASALYDRAVTLFSLHSVSKGFYGECGHRGGYLEVRNAAPIEGSELSFYDVIQKQASVSLCSNTIGQLMVWLLATPPQPTDPSYGQFCQERDAILDELYAKAQMIREAFNEMEGMEIHGKTGAMYLFPKLGKLPANKSDFDYCMALLEQTGLTTVNGSGFGQQEGTAHLRIAFLPPKEMLEEVLPAWIKFHNQFVNS